MNAKTVKFLAALAVLAMAFAAVAILSPADESDATDATSVATYADLEAAVTQDNFDIILTEDIVLSDVDATIVIAKGGTINLNGHNITATDKRIFHILSGKVTIEGEGTISADHAAGEWSNGSSVIRVGDGGTYTNVEDPTKVELTIGEGVTVSTNFAYAISVFGAETEEKLIVKGSLSTTGEEAAALGGNGQDKYTPTIIIIDEGASVYSMYDYAIYHPQLGELTISGEVEGMSGVEIKGGDVLTVGDSGSITANAVKKTHEKNNNGASTSGYAVAVVENSAYSGSPQATLSNGIINGDVVLAADDEVSSEKIGTITIKGATINGNICTSVDESYANKAPAGKFVFTEGTSANAKGLSANVEAGTNIIKTTNFEGSIDYPIDDPTVNSGVDILSIGMTAGSFQIATGNTFNGSINSGNSSVSLQNVKAGSSGITIAKGSIIISGEMDVSGAQSLIDAAGGDVIISDLTVTGDDTLVLTGDITIEGITGLTLQGVDLVIGDSEGKKVTKVDLKEKITTNSNIDIYGGLTIEAGATIEETDTDKKITIEESAKVTGLAAGILGNIVLDEKFILTGAAPIDLSDFPTVINNNKEYVVFGVDFGDEKPIYGILKTSVPFTGKPIVPENVTVAGTSFADVQAQTVKSITFTELPSDEDFDDNFHAGASHTYKTKISTAYNGDSQYFSVMVPYVITKVDSEVVFSEYDETTVEGIEIDKIMPGSTVEMSAEVAHKVIIDAEVKYYSGDDDHEAGYYIVAKVASADPEKVTLKNAKYLDPISKEWKSLTDGYILAYIGPEFPAGGELITTVDIDLDGPEGCAKDGEIYDDYKTTTYTVQLNLSENLGIELIPIITEKDMTEALKFTDLKNLYGKLPQDLQTSIKFEVNKGAQNNQPTALEYDVTIKGMLKYVYDYDDWDTDAKGYFLAYYIALPEGKEWKNAKVTFEKDGSTSTYDPNNQDNPKTFDGFMVVKVTKPGITQTVTIVIDDKTFIWNLKFDAFDAEGEELLTFEPAATYEAVMPEDKTVFGITLDDTTDKTFYMVFMNTIKSDLTINLYYLGNKTEKEEGAVPIYTEDESNLPFWAEKDVGMYIWYASFEYQLKDIECQGGNYLIEVLGKESVGEEGEKEVLVASDITTVSGQESKITFAHVHDGADLLGKEIEQIVDGKLTFTVGEFVEPTDEADDGYYPVTVTGVVHYVKDYTGYNSKNTYYQSGFYLPYDILVGNELLPEAGYDNMEISLEALQDEIPFTKNSPGFDGTFITFVGKDSSKFPKIIVKVDLDGEKGTVFAKTTYVLSLAPADGGDGGVTVGNLDIILVDEANEVLTFNIPEGKYFKLPNGKDNTKEFDAWNLDNLDKVQDTYSDESVYVVSYNDVTTEGEFAGKVVFTATYTEKEDPVIPVVVTYDVKVKNGDKIIPVADDVLEGAAVTMPKPEVADDKIFVGYAINGNIIGAQYIVSGIDAVNGVITIDVVTSDKPVYSTNVFVSVQKNTVTLVALDGLKIEGGTVTVTFQYWGKVLGAWKLLDATKTFEYDGGDSVIQITVDVPDVPAPISYVKASFVYDSGYSAPESGRTVYE